MKVVILEDTNRYKSGEILNIDNFSPEGFFINENFISKHNYIKEDLSIDDLKKINILIDKKLKLIFWRLYTKSKFILQ